MSREIKFRAFDKESKQMVYQDEQTTFHFNIGFEGIDSTKSTDEREWSWLGSMNCKLMQFTGIVDQNNKDIYESDILNVGKQNEVVKFQEGCFFLGSVPLVMSAGHRVVIGNIHQDPELLK